MSDTTEISLVEMFIFLVISKFRNRLNHDTKGNGEGL
jgi:hypothetical protein